MLLLLCAFLRDYLNQIELAFKSLSPRQRLELNSTFP